MKITNGWLDAALEIDYSQKSMSRAGHTPKFLVLHGTAGGTSAQAIANYFAGSADASAHFIIGVDGTIVQGVSIDLAAWANGPIDGVPANNLGFRTQSDGAHRDSWWNPSVNPNWITISIEHCKPDNENATALTPAQQDASFKLIACICDAYGIPKRFADSQGGITGHFSMSAINRQHCPGLYPWDALWKYLAQGGNTPMPPQPPTTNQVKAATNRWNSVLKNTPEGAAPTGSGIYNAWLSALVDGKFYGPPLTHEYDSNDWDGKPIVVQEFAYCWCEWDRSAHWYDAEGAMD